MNDKYKIKYIEFNKIPKILHMVWVGENSPPNYFYENLIGWIKLMPDWDFKVWSNDSLTEYFFDSKYLKLINSGNHGAQKADMIRYYVIKKLGGFYIDADIIPNKSLEDILNLNTSIVVCHDLPITWPYIINSFFGAIPNHPAINLACEKVFNCDLNSPDIHMQTGPKLFGECINTFGLDKVSVLHPNCFYRNMTGQISLTKNSIDFIKLNNKNDGEFNTQLSLLYSECCNEKYSNYLDHNIDWRFGSHSYERTW
jgi:mannosyltransferase OCH1-like enzyme